MPQVLRIYADGLSDYEDCTSLSWRCRMTFVNSTQSVINPGDWVPQDNCILCRPLPTSGVGMLQVVVELLALDGKRSAGASDVPVDIWLPVIESTVIYCQVGVCARVFMHVLCVYTRVFICVYTRVQIATNRAARHTPA